MLWYLTKQVLNISEPINSALIHATFIDFPKKSAKLQLPDNAAQPLNANWWWQSTSTTRVHHIYIFITTLTQHRAAVVQGRNSLLHNLTCNRMMMRCCMMHVECIRFAGRWFHYRRACARATASNGRSRCSITRCYRRRRCVLLLLQGNRLQS